MTEDQLLSEQRRYYDARAGEYDEWWERRGRYDLGPEGNAAWAAEVAAARRIMDGLPWGGEVLEFAAGTGYWTAYLAGRVRSVHVVDASEPMLALNRRRLAGAGLLQKVSYERADLFAWTPRGAYDAAFAGFWVSHVPAERLDGFFATVAAVLKPGGLFAFLEGAGRSLASPKQGTIRHGDDLETRKLNDGRTFRIVKRDSDPGDCAPRLRRAGLRPAFQTTPSQFLVGTGIKE